MNWQQAKHAKLHASRLEKALIGPDPQQKGPECLCPQYKIASQSRPISALISFFVAIWVHSTNWVTN